jgi:predicted DNA-binding transcriptional regulator AlpA
VLATAPGCSNTAGAQPDVYDLDTTAWYPDRQLKSAAMKVDPSDLLNAREVASVLGLAHREAIATYRRRYPDFPAPVVVKGTCVLWLRHEVDAWAKATGRL